MAITPGLISDAAAKAVFDDVAYAWLNKDALGAVGYPRYAYLSALDNPDLDLAGILAEAFALDAAMIEAAWYKTLFTGLLNSIVKHLQAPSRTSATKAVYAGIDEFLTARAFRVHTAFAEVWRLTLGGATTRLAKANVYDAAGIVLGTINWSASGTGALTDGTTTDETYTGGNALQWRIPTGKSVTSSSVTLTLKRPDATTEEKTVTIVGAAGDVGAIGTPGTDKWTDLVSISVNSGGANGNQAIIESVCDRAPAPIA